MFLSPITAPLNAQFNEAVVSITKRIVHTFTVSDDAPSTYRQLKDHMDSGAEMVVYGGGSGTTIFGAPEVNHAFRAWHDWCHWKGENDFSLQGEMGACCTMLQHVQRFYGLNSQTCYWKNILIAEIIGQSRYYWKHKDYVTNQRAFCLAYMEDADAALNSRW